MNWLKYVYNYFIILFLTFLVISSVDAQGNELYFKYKEKGYGEIILEKKQKYEIKLQNNDINILNNYEMRSLILSEAGKRNITESIFFSELKPLISHEAYTLPSGKGKKIPSSGFIDKTANRGNIFHDDLKERFLSFSNLEIGATKYYAYTTQIKDPHLMQGHYFTDHIPVEKSTLEIVVDNNVEIGYSIINDPEEKINFEIETKKGKKIYRWSLQEIEPLEKEYHSPGYLHIAPHIIVYIKNYTLNNSHNLVLGTVDLLYKYYKDLIQNINLNEHLELKNKAIELTKDYIDQEDKIKAIYYWVKDNIKYVAFEYGYDGFIPRDADVVYDRKFGDCKDMANLIVQMAQYAGIHNVGLCWIGTRTIPYNYIQVPTPSSDNHMIAYYETSSNLIYLDATDSEIGYGLPTAFIQGKEALLAYGQGYKTAFVPVVEPSTNRSIDSIYLILSENKLKGSGALSLYGIARSETLHILGDSKNKMRSDKIKTIVKKGNNKFSLLNYNETNNKDRDKPFLVNYEFELDNYVLKTSDQLFINFFLEKPLTSYLIEADRKSDFEFEFLTKRNFIINFEIPSGYHLQVVPQSQRFDNDLLGYLIEYSLNENILTLNYEIINKKLLINQSDFPLWNEGIKNLKSIYNESVVLTKNKNY